MKRLLLALGIVALLAAQASAVMSSGQGGYVYWSNTNAVPPTIPNYTTYQLFRLEFDASWTIVTPGANFDNIPFVNSGAGAPYGSFPNSSRNNNLEVLDPRDQGGFGNILHTSITNNTPPAGGYAGNAWQQPWDIVKEVPSTTVKTLLSDGAQTNWTSSVMGKAVVAPPNWLGYTDCGLSLVGIRNFIFTDAVALHDAGGNGQIDDTATEGASLGIGGQTMDVEMGGDATLYYSTSAAIYKQWGAGAGNRTTFYTFGGGATNPLSASTDGTGIAVGKGSSNPIVYVLAMDNEPRKDDPNNLNEPPTTRVSIFALRDGDGDCVVSYTDPNDIVKELWNDGDFSLNVYNGIYGGEDVEYYMNPETGKQFLLFNSYYDYEGLFVLELADNGLMAVTGKNITAGAGLFIPAGDVGGFELDMNPVPQVPEPATLLLFGTGALGALGWMRRRRMK